VITPHEEFYMREHAVWLADVRDLLLRHPELAGEGLEFIARRLPGSPDPAVIAALLDALNIEGCGVCP
jgi:hypothetical protein